MRQLPLAAALLALIPALAACGSTRDESADPQSAFLVELAALEGRAYAGRVLADEPAQAANPFAGQTLVMHVRRVEPDRLEIPFHVGADRSRTWVITRTPQGLRLKHDHRHADGSEDELTQYGGDTADRGSARRQEFPVDAYSRALFERTQRSVSTTNVWAMEIEPGRSFVYELARKGRMFRVEFDLTQPIPPPPAPWGHE